MDPFEVRDSLESLTVLVDTREQDTPAFRRRMRALGCPYRREKLDSGDYSVVCTLPGGAEYSLANEVVIERKMALDEACQNFTRGRERFIREFDRLRERGGKAYLLIENAGWEDVFSGNYRSRFHPNALVASLKAWEARYNTHILFCPANLTGQMIYKTLYYELKERLESGAADELCTGN